jgi:ParB family chromosome partitioning protein
MKIAIASIKATERIRKLTAKVDELAADITKNGLINPITVMEIEGGKYQLLAGLRRLRAAQSLGLDEIEATVAQPKDAEAALNIEYSENIQREAFTYSEKMDYARLIDEIERAKAAQRKSEGQSLGGATAGNGRPLSRCNGDRGPHCNSRKPSVRDIVGEKIGMSGRQYDRAKYIAEHASQDTIDELDAGVRKVRVTYDELRSNDAKPVAVSVVVEKVPEKLITPRAEAVTIDPVKPTEPAPTLLSALDRAIRAESELDAMKYRQHNEIYHRDSIIENLRMRVAELTAALDKANARIKELEMGTSGTDVDQLTSA